MSKRLEAEPKKVNLITEELFRETYRYEDVHRPPVAKLIANKLKCTKSTWLNFFPIASWLAKYNIKTSFLSDIIAGFTVAIMHIPHGLAYAPLGKVEPVVGFYMAVFPVFIYIFMGTSRHISLGTFAVLCTMVGQVVTKHGNAKINSKLLESNETTTEAPDDALSNIEIGSAVCLMVGLWELFLGMFKMGSLTVVMSESLTSGFSTGAAIHVLSLQLKNLTGVNVSAFFGIFKLFYIYIDFFSKIKTVHLVTILMSCAYIAFLLLFSLFLIPLFQKKYAKNKIPIPIELIAIILGIIFSYFLQLSEKYGVKIVNEIPTGFPKPSIPPMKLLPSLILDCLILAIVAIAINLSLTRIFAKKGNYSVSNNQELIAYGASNIFAAFFCCLPSAASLSRSSVQYAVGGKTQLASFFSLILVTFILLVAGSLFEPVPYCVLSSIVVVSLKSLLMQMGDVPKIWRQSIWDGIVWVGTFLAVIILDLDYGLGVGVILSIASILFSSHKVKIQTLGRVPETNLFLDIDRYKAAETIPHILILKIIGNLNFSNCNTFENLVLTLLQQFFKLKTQEQSYVIFDLSSVIRIDPTSVNTLKDMNKYLKKQNCDLFLTDCNIEVYKAFEDCQLFNDIPKDQVLASVADAVEYLTSII